MVYATETSIKEYNEIQQNTFGTIEVKYTRPKFVHRILANLLDFIVFAFIAIAGFLGTREILKSTGHYKATMKELSEARLNSGLYVLGDYNEVTDLISYMNSHSNYTYSSKVYLCEKHLDQFLIFEATTASLNKYSEIVDQYDAFRLAAVGVSNGSIVHLWEKDSSGKIVKTDFYNTAKYYYAAWYATYFDYYLQGYLATNPYYYDLTKTISNYLFYLQIPVSFGGSLILIYFVPTLFFRHGRMTLGKWLYHIGTVDSRYLSPTFWRNLAKFGIFFFEMIAGVASLGILFIISVSMMAFSKKRQSFPEFMLGLQEVDTSKNRVYMSMVEIQLKNVKTNKKANDFRLIDNP